MAEARRSAPVEQALGVLLAACGIACTSLNEARTEQATTGMDAGRTPGQVRLELDARVELAAQDIPDTVVAAAADGAASDDASDDASAGADAGTNVAIEAGADAGELDAGGDRAPDTGVACVAAADLGMPCGSCGGATRCDGSCSIDTPASYGQACGSCGGATRCDGSCDRSTPADLGAACGSCGGSVQCDGSCSVATPGNLGAACGLCGGSIQCNGACSVATPANLGNSCGSCGGTIQCNGACSVGTPINFGASCGSCGGRVECNGQCSRSTPHDLGAVSLYSSAIEAFSCCFIDYQKTFGGTCDPGHTYAGCSISKISGGGTCAIIAGGSGGDCSCRVRFHNNGTDGATCEVAIHQRRICD